jgi:hypothetical protein
MVRLFDLEPGMGKRMYEISVICQDQQALRLKIETSGIAQMVNITP